MSNFFEWDAKYNLGVNAMDDEHRLIVDAMNQLHVLHEAHAPASQLAKVMSQLVRVTRDHFADEEAYMAKIGFPDRVKHKQIHTHLLQRLDHRSRIAREGRRTGRPVSLPQDVAEGAHLRHRHEIRRAQQSGLNSQRRNG